MWQSDSVFVLMLVAGIAGGLGHCSGMCGPLVILLAPRQGGTTRTLRLHLGRLLSYSLLGAGLAFLSAVLALEIDFLPARRLLMAAAGTVLIFSGLSTLGLRFLSRLRPLAGSAPIRRVTQWARSSGPLTLGLLWGLLPCGLLYSAYAAAAATGAAADHPLIGALQGALVMVLFGSGTTPPLIGIGWAAQQLAADKRIWLQRIAGAIVAISGILLIVNAF